jgi:hypothetical protein
MKQVWRRRRAPRLQLEADLQQLTWWILDVRRDIIVIRRILEDAYGWEDPETDS